MSWRNVRSTHMRKMFESESRTRPPAPLVLYLLPSLPYRTSLYNFFLLSSYFLKLLSFNFLFSLFRRRRGTVTRHAPHGRTTTYSTTKERRGRGTKKGNKEEGSTQQQHEGDVFIIGQFRFEFQTNVAIHSSHTPSRSPFFIHLPYRLLLPHC